MLTECTHVQKNVSLGILLRLSIMVHITLSLYNSGMRENHRALTLVIYGKTLCQGRHCLSIPTPTTPLTMLKHI